MILKKIANRFITSLSALTKRNLSVNVVSLSPNKLLEGRCALITGGTSGIGLEIAKSFVQSGACVIITGRNKERISAALSQFPMNKAVGIVWDNTEISSFENKFEDALEFLPKLGVCRIDILVNNAGVNFKGMPNASEPEYDKVMDTNLKGVFFLSQLFGKYLIKNRINGNILNIASASSLRPADSAYTLSKWGIRALTLGLAKSLGPEGITVNGIAPGPTATPMMLKEKDANMELNRLPLGRYISATEISNMAVILVSDMGRSIMGDIIYMTGGVGLLTYDDVPYSFN